MGKEYAVQMRKITKRFGNIVANDKVSLDLEKGEILSLLGENGSGKTTLMNMLSGIYYPDEGEIIINGEEVKITSPKDAYTYGIGMIHQHFKLVDVFTAAQNIVLGLEEKGRFDMKAVGERVKQIADRYGFQIDPEQKIYEMSVSQKQTVEIVKALYRGAQILILDEPTAVLTPQESVKLFNVMRSMKQDGKSIIIITHKLNEVMEISDRVAVLRKGEYIGCVNTADTNQQSLTDMMVGRATALDIYRPEPKDTKDCLVVEHLTCLDKDGVKRLDDVSFTARTGEILGIAGIAGSGQKELLEAISGLYPVAEGDIKYIDEAGVSQSLVGLDPLEIRKLGVGMAFVPEDRLGMGLVGSMGMTGNMMLRSWRNGKSLFVDRKAPDDLANEIWHNLEVVTPSTSFPVRRMSGGNVQKVLVGREIASAHRVMMTAYVVRGLDINTSYMIYNLLTEEKMRGNAVVYVGEDLDVLLALCDRMIVLCGGQISGIVDCRNTTKNEVGLLMTQFRKEEAANE